MTHRTIVLGGGTAGWMAAASLAHNLGRMTEVTLIESAEIGIVGVGEATLPHIRHFIEQLGIAEDEFMAATEATFKLGIRFEGFGAIGDSYIHPFGAYGQDIANVPFHHYWLEAAWAGLAAPIGDYSMGVAAAAANRFAIPALDGELKSTYGYAYQFDATKFGPFMRAFSERKGVTRIEAKVVEVERDGDSGDVAALLLDNGTRIAGDLFVDCSGFRSLLLGDTLGEAWEDWSGWLPCDRAVALPCTAPEGEIEPFTRAVAMPAGWRWRIPLQHRIGNGYVYSSAHVGDDEAADAIGAAVEGTPLADPRVLRFRAGRRRHSWSRNVVAIGLASGFLEPLESTSIYLAQMAIARLVELFPLGGVDPADRTEFNRMVDMEYDRIRDFLILHYNATTRDDSPFWDHVRTMRVPDSLGEKIELWRATARVAHYSEGLFLEPSWIAVYLGQGIVPAGNDPRAGAVPAQGLGRALDRLAKEVAREVAALPGHRAYLEASRARLTAEAA